MASCQTSKWVSTSPYVRLTVEIDSSASDGDTAVVRYKLEYTAVSASRTYHAKSYTINIAGGTVKTGSYDIDGKTGTHTITSGTTNITKGKTSHIITFDVDFAFEMTWSDVYAGTRSASGTLTIPAKTSYAITYNANGGSGAPSSQTKWFGETLKLSTTKPTRSGYTFKGWATSSTATTATYAAGANYTANAKATLYAVWQTNNFTITYNGNASDATNVPSAQTKEYGKNITIAKGPTRSGYTFKGWATSASGSVKYSAGATYTANASITLYAVWTSSYTKPTISSMSVTRCDSAGSANDGGTYALVKCSWKSTKTISSVVIKWKLTSASSYPSANSKTVTASGTNGDVNEIIGANALSTENTYDIQVTVTDSGGNTSKRLTLNAMLIPLDFLAGGKGVAFGKPAELEDTLDVGFQTRMRRNLICDNGFGLYGQTTDGKTLQVAYINANNNTVIGYGGHSANTGSTNLYGNDLNIQANNTIKVNGLTFAANKALYSGSGLYMSSTQSCTLAEGISKQVNGVVLVWSEYNSTDGTGENANFNFTFIPRRFAVLHDGKGVSSFCSSATGNVMALKYVYVSDTTITGYANNNADEYTTTSGIKMSPKKFVLRYVIGV